MQPSGWHPRREEQEQSAPVGRNAGLQDVNLVKSGCMEKQTAQHLAAFWILIAGEMNATKKRFNPF
jgi:hypothetical protein